MYATADFDVIFMQQQAIMPLIYATTDDYATDACNSRLRQQIYARTDFGNTRRAHSHPPVALLTAFVWSRSLGPQ